MQKESMTDRNPDPVGRFIFGAGAILVVLIANAIVSLFVKV